MKRFLVLLFCLAVVVSVFAYRYAPRKRPMPRRYARTTDSTDVYYRQWLRVDSLLNAQNPKSAAALIDSIYAVAGAHNQPVILLKASIYYLKVTGDTAQNAQKEMIVAAQAREREAAFPYKAIWQSILAQLYWKYYDANRYNILNRTAIAGPAGNDFELWDANSFYVYISGLYRQSLANAAQLKTIDITTLAPVLNGDNTAHLRPTLYDLLAFRALSYLNDGEKDLPSPAEAFTLNDDAAIATAAVFAAHKFVTPDTSSALLQAVHMYQQLLRMHQNDDDPAALIDADLHRLQYMYEKSTAPGKAALYHDALQHLAAAWPGNEMAAEARVALARLDAGLDDDYGENNIFDISEHRKKVDFPAINRQLQDIITSFPGSRAATQATYMSGLINRQVFSITAETAVPANEPCKMLVTYRNINKIYVHVVRIPAYVARNLRPQTYISTAPVDEFEVALPGTEDNYNHNAEVRIGALKPGEYYVFTSVKKNIGADTNKLASNLLRVTDLCYMHDASNGGGNLILNRKTGEPMAGVNVCLMKENAASITLQHKTEADGSFPGFTSSNYYYGDLLATYKGDTLYTRYNEYHRYDHKDPAENRTFFFTDRAIYRPGQTVYFKGIMARVDSNGRKAAVVAGQATTVTFENANDEKVKTLKLKTNEYGSFTGSFVVPEGGLTGSYTVKNESGSTAIQVEEYKRPKFKTDFDTLAKAVALNEKMTITGTAAAYAGSNIDGAVVKYQVVRTTRWDNWWNYFRSYPEADATQEIASGNTKTDAQGKFAITFVTLPDAAEDKSTLPVFTYTIQADVTDINGETHSATQQISAGYVSVKISATVPDEGSPAQLAKLHMRTETLDGNFLPGKATIKISRLQQPGQMYRPRLWAAPDQWVMSEADFRRSFPQDEYKEEGNYRHWPVAATVYDQTITTTRDGHIEIPATAWQHNGRYVVAISTKDKSGTEVTDKRYVEVWGEGNGGAADVPLLVTPAEQEAETGQAVKVYITGNLGPCMLWQQQANANSSITTDTRRSTGLPLLWQQQLTAADRGGVMLYYTTFKNNRMYNGTARIAVPWTDKDLSLEWETHRDKLLPGAKETWTVTVKGAKKEKVAAEMLAGMYDASLDEFSPHRWDIRGLWPENRHDFRWASDIGMAQNDMLKDNMTAPPFPAALIYQDIILFGEDIGIFRNKYALHRAYKGSDQTILMDRVMLAGGKTDDESGAKSKSMTVAYTMAIVKSGDIAKNEVPPPVPAGMLSEAGNARPETAGAPAYQWQAAANKDIPLRKNLQELAFFYPQLLTDAEGNIKFSFTMPEALTEWRFMALAHTPGLAFGQVSGTVKTQKELMVFPGLPRFLRQGDELELSAKISNLSEKDLSGGATIELADAVTLEPLNTAFGIKNSAATISAPRGRSAVATWRVHVPGNIYNPVVVRIKARAGNFTDGEENTLPVVSNRMMVTETLPMWVNGNGEKSYRIEKLLHADTATTLAQYGLTVEYTANPAWYAILALPYLAEFPHECAEQTFNRYYANALAAHIAHLSPKVEQVFRKWQSADTAALLSALEKNAELKSALLQETPWVMEAKTETEQRHRIAVLFNTAKLAAGQRQAATKLAEMQMDNGAFPWFRGCNEGDRYITQYIVTGIGHLHHLGVPVAAELDELAKKAVAWLDADLKTDYDRMKAAKTNLAQQQISYYEVQYLYMRSFFKDIPVPAATREAYDYYRHQGATYQPAFNSYMRGMIALALARSGDRATANIILASLREKAHHSDELGMYWAQQHQGYWWYEAPVEEQALLIECFAELTKDTAAIDAMKLWLLKQKQTENWHTTTATAGACYALLLTGNQWLVNEPQVRINVGAETINSSSLKQEAGTGYFKVRYGKDQVSPKMGSIKVNVQGNDHGASWGAVYWQYFEQLDKITGAATEITINKQLFISHNGARGTELTPITGKNSLKVGDKVVVRLEITAGRDMDYVHLKDMRAACFEPINVLSEYKYQGGLGYYQSSKDISENFFISHLYKGKYVLEYPVYVTHTGDFSSGIATLQCMYAPEFSSHSNGGRMHVER